MRPPEISEGWGYVVATAFAVVATAFAIAIVCQVWTAERRRKQSAEASQRALEALQKLCSAVQALSQQPFQARPDSREPLSEASLLVSKLTAQLKLADEGGYDNQHGGATSAKMMVITEAEQGLEEINSYRRRVLCEGGSRPNRSPARRRAGSRPNRSPARRRAGAGKVR